MATWHQNRRPVKLFHATQWTVVTDPPNGMRTLALFTDEAGAKKSIENLAKHHPTLAKHSYILPPESASLKRNPKTESRELALFIQSDGELYRRQTLPIIKNLQRKIAKGTYDKQKALILWKHLADSGAQRYAKESGGDWNAGPGAWHKMFSVADRKEVAKELADYYEEHLMEAVQRNPKRRNKNREIVREGYVGILEAASGVLLGGVKRHVSTAFDNREDAQAWLDQAVETNEGAGRKIKNAHVSPAKIYRAKRNPTARIRRPAQTRRRSGFPGHIVTFIRPNAFYHKRQYIGGSKGRWTVVYKRNLAQVFSTSDKAKNVVRNNRKWFELNGIKQVTILQTNEHIGKFE